MRFVSEWFFVVGSPFYSYTSEAHEQDAYMYDLFPPCHQDIHERQSPEWNLLNLLTNSLATSPLVFTLGFAAKTKALTVKSLQLRRLAIGSYTRLLAVGFFSKGHLDEWLRVLPHNPSEYWEKKKTASSLELCSFELSHVIHSSLVIGKCSW